LGYLSPKTNDRGFENTGCPSKERPVLFESQHEGLIRPKCLIALIVNGMWWGFKNNA
jgi:hypothetical protein